MSVIRNPFLSKFTRTDTSDMEFLRCFGPSILDQIKFERIWEIPFIIQGTPGTGKTSLLRLFTPGVLSELYRSRKEEDLHELSGKLMQHNVIDKHGPCCLGILIQCTENFAQLNDLEFDDAKRSKLFFGLLNAHIALAALRGIALLNDFSIHDDLNKVQVSGEILSSLDGISNGKEIYDWAKQTVRRIGEILDSFGSMIPGELRGTEPFAILDVLKMLKLNGNFVSQHFLIMLDDMHILAREQRDILLRHVISSRIPGVWLAERLQSLGYDELLTLGDQHERDYIQVDLEFKARTSQHVRNRHYEDIANRRIESMRRDILLPRLSSSLNTDPRASDLPDLQNIISVLKDRVADLFSKLYQGSVFSDSEQHEVSLDNAISLQIKEILLSRQISKSNGKQLSLISEEVVDIDYVFLDVAHQSTSSSERIAAFVLLHHEFDVPLYYGSDTVINLASANVAQFLSICAPLYDEIIAAKILGKSSDLSPKRQHQLIKNFAVNKWEEIRRSIPNFNDVRKLLEAIGKLCQTNTLSKNAPYAPGVTGVGLDIDEFELLKPGHPNTRSKQFSPLLRALIPCILYNFLQLREVNQGGKRWCVLYLNRWICVRFGLPMQYGGWRPTSLPKLLEGVEKGFFSRTTRGTLV